MYYRCRFIPTSPELANNTNYEKCKQKLLEFCDLIDETQRIITDIDRIRGVYSKPTLKIDTRIVTVAHSMLQLMEQINLATGEVTYYILDTRTYETSTLPDGYLFLETPITFQEFQQYSYLHKLKPATYSYKTLRLKERGTDTLVLLMLRESSDARLSIIYYCNSIESWKEHKNYPVLVEGIEYYVSIGKKKAIDNLTLEEQDLLMNPPPKLTYAQKRKLASQKKKEERAAKAKAKVVEIPPEETADKEVLYTPKDFHARGRPHVLLPGIYTIGSRTLNPVYKKKTEEDEEE